ncbi:MAG TPA: glycosyltransferase [Pyrinomonadaceae bacterium]|nr:glycosyltransferase [Pyrinomonadaceae bacterium]
MSRTSKYNGAVVVVPTRNRAQLAMNAVRSVIDQPVDDFHILVSDNSTSAEDREALESFCASLGDSRVRYVRPPQPFAMPAHWEWAINQALADYDATHFTYLTDRMMFRDGALKDVLGLAAIYPDKVITYNHDRICDDARPIRVEQYQVTGKLLEVESQRLISLFADAVLHHGLPRMLNCIVPRRVFDRIRQRFGNVFTSIAPDFNFCFRCLDIEESVLFYDMSPLFHYALDRSNGASASRGEATPDTNDFEANLPVDNAVRNYATPIPSLITSTNAAYNEYLIYKKETGSSKFIDVDVQKYLRANAVEITDVRDPRLRSEMHALLVQHGLSDEVANESRPAWRTRLSSVVGKLKRAGSETQPRDPEFANIDEAIHYLRHVSHGNQASWTWGADVLHGRELPVGTTIGQLG